MTFEDEWSRCGPWIQAALDHAANTHDLGHVEAMVRAGEAQFWPREACAAVTQIVRHPNFSALHLWLAGGDLDALVSDLRPAIEAWAICAHGVTRATVLGRSGWGKPLGPHGYKTTSRLLVKELT